jgi:hypothetical protein
VDRLKAPLTLVGRNEKLLLTFYGNVLYTYSIVNHSS